MAEALEKLIEKYAFSKPKEDEFITSGSVILDGVVSQGRGIPKGKFIQLSSESGVGKCVVGSTMVCIDGKMGYIKDFFGDDFDGFRESSRKVLSVSDGKASNLDVSYDYREVVDRVYSIVTEDNYTLKGTADHKILVIGDGKPEWKSMCDVSVGDEVYLTPKFITHVDLDREFYLKGLSLGIPKKVTFNNEVPAYYQQLLGQEFKDSYKTSFMDTPEGQTYCFLFDKKPGVVETSPCTPEQFLSYLHGCLSVQGTYSSGVFTARHTETLSFFQKGCSLLGIRTVRSDDCLSLEFSKDELMYLSKLFVANVELDNSVTTAKVKVKSYKDKQSVVYDLTVPDHHAFSTSGFLSHNTTMVLYACRRACDAGKKVLYIDAERGVNESQMEGIGLIKYLGTQFLLCDVSTFEDADSLITAALEDPDIAYIVIDSLTMLVPKKLLENNVEKTEIGLEARSTSTFLKKFKALLRNSPSQPTFLFIAQQRVKFRGFTAVTTAAGGNASIFSMDIRINMRATEKLFKVVKTADGSTKIPYGAQVLIVPEKNRFSYPGVTGTATVIYGKGISNLEAYIQYLKYYGALSQGGANFSIELPGKEPIKIKGKAAMKEAVKEHLAEIKEFIDSKGGFGILPKDENGNLIGEEAT